MHTCLPLWRLDFFRPTAMDRQPLFCSATRSQRTCGPQEEMLCKYRIYSIQMTGRGAHKFKWQARSRLNVHNTAGDRTISGGVLADDVSQGRDIYKYTYLDQCEAHTSASMFTSSIAISHTEGQIWPNVLQPKLSRKSSAWAKLNNFNSMHTLACRYS